MKDFKSRQFNKVLIMTLQACQQNDEVNNPQMMENALFEKRYRAVRIREQRIYTDEELALLPVITAQHPHSKEWLVRKASAERLSTYLERRHHNLQILEVGCGNGWLCNHLASNLNATVTGLDVNLTELSQAQRVFSGRRALSFVYGDLRSGVLQGASFDVVVFAASIQYFPVLGDIISTALGHLKAAGELHIIDTHFYTHGQMQAAKERTKAYYTALGIPEMGDHYFHHLRNDLHPFRHAFLLDPFSLLNRLTGKNQCFPWIRIRHR